MGEVGADEFVVAGAVAGSESLGILLGYHEAGGGEQERVVEDAGDLERGGDTDLLTDIAIPMDGERIEGNAYGAREAGEAQERQKEDGNGTFHNGEWLMVNG